MNTAHRPTINPLEPRQLLSTVPLSPPLLSPLASITAFVVGDFNHDGKPDVIARTAADPALHFYPGLGNGKFGPPSTAGPGIAAGLRVSVILSADFNHDGNADLAVLNADVPANTGVPSAGDVRVLLGKGDGTFSPAVTYNAGPAPRDLAITDYNADGRPDLVTANAGSWSPLTGGSPTYGGAVLLDSPTGTFSPATRIPLIGPSTSVAATPFQLPTATNIPATTLAFAGTNPLVTTIAPQTTITILRPSASNATTLLTLPGTNLGLAPASFSNDKITDFAALQSPLVNSATALSGPTVHTITSKPASTPTAPITFQSAGPFPTLLAAASSIQAADLDGDGFSEVVVAGRLTLNAAANTGFVSQLSGNADGKLSAPRLSSAGLLPASLSIADLNADNRPDLLLSGPSGLSALLQSRPTTFANNRTDSFFPGTPTAASPFSPSPALLS